MPELKFEKECPACHQMWLTFNGKVCPDCEDKKIKPPKVEPKKVAPDPVVGENDALEDYQKRKDIFE